jgi:hypothetical protein
MSAFSKIVRGVAKAGAHGADSSAARGTGREAGREVVEGAARVVGAEGLERGAEIKIKLEGFYTKGSATGTTPFNPSRRKSELMAEVRDELKNVVEKTIKERLGLTPAEAKDPEVREIVQGLILGEARNPKSECFSPGVRELIRAGERSGRLPDLIDEALDRIASSAR